MCQRACRWGSRHRLLLIALQLFVLWPYVVLGQAHSSKNPADERKPGLETPTVDRVPAGTSGVIPDPALEPVRELLAQGRVTDAEREARKYEMTHADSAEGHFLLGLILFQEQRPKDSLAEYTEGAKHHNPDGFDLRIVALNYVLLGDYANADHWLTRSVKENPQDKQAWYYLGRTKYNENRFEEAIAAFERCLTLDSRNVKAKDNLGLSYAGLGRTQEAFAAYRTAMEWQSDLLNKDPGPLINMGSLLLDQNRVGEAVPYLLQAVTAAPDDVRGHEQLGKAYSRLDDLPKAQQELERAVSLLPENSNLHFMLGQVYRKRGMSEKAKSELDKGAALKNTPSSQKNGTD